MSVHLLEDYLAPQERPVERESTAPSFEGNAVDFNRVKLTGTSNLDCEEPIKIDQEAKFFIQGIVTAVNHQVDPKTGKIIRIHTVKVQEAIQLNWNAKAEDF